MKRRQIFVLGGARSGKSSFAERLVAECGSPVLYVATATATDDEMAERIARHLAQRPASWLTLEAPIAPAAAVREVLGGISGDDEPTVLVEDLTLLLANLLDLSCADHAEAQATRELEELLQLPAHVVLVSNEVGMGIVPPYPSGRQFRDALGRVNQRAAALCSEAYFLVAGVPLRLK